MARLIVFGMLLLAGCQSLNGPFAPRQPTRVDDPLLSISEQQRTGRDRLATPEPSPNVAPRTYADADFTNTAQH